MRDTIEKVIKSRAIRCIKKITPLLNNGKYYIGGGCLSGDSFNDIDIFPVDNEDFKNREFKGIEVITNTKNAITLKINGAIVQFCSYKRSSLDELVNSFDFSHIQVGVLIEDGTIKEVYWSDAFEEAKIIESSEFINSQYPLSSLIRLFKYHKREKLTKTATIRASIKILTKIISRGFKNYEDFKDQLDAVDLGLVPEELGELDYIELKELYELLVKG